MTFEQEAYAYQLFERATALPVSEQVAWLQAQSPESCVLEEVMSLLSLHAQTDSTGVSGLTTAGNWLRGAHGDGDDLLGVTLGDYHIDSRVRAPDGRNRGGMGFVYRAHRADGAYEKTVAIKVIQWAQSLRERELFLQERRHQASLHHSHIVGIQDAGTTPDGRPYFVMDWVEDGTDLTDYCRSLSLRARIELFLPVCGAVRFAHKRGLLHRDIKPSNIQVDGNGIPKLLDFGLSSRLTENAAGDPALSILTPAYASPEQLRGEDLTTATDMYSLGVILFELLHGVRPTPESGQAIQIVDAELDAIVARMMAPEPAARYDDIELEAELRRWLAGEPVEAFRAHVRAPVLYSARKFAWRNRSLVAVGIAAILALAGSFVWIVEARNAALRESGRANREKQEALKQSREAREQRQEADSQRLLAERNGQAARKNETEARSQAARAEEQRRLAVARQLASQAQVELDSGNVETAALLAVESNRIRESFQANQVMRRALGLLPRHVLAVALPCYADRLQYSANSEFIAVLCDEEGRAEIRRTDTGELLIAANHGKRPNCSHCGAVEAAFNPSRPEAATTGYDGSIRIWDLTQRRLRHSIDDSPGFHALFEHHAGTELPGLRLEHRIALATPHLPGDYVTRARQLLYWNDGITLAASASRKAQFFDSTTGQLKATMVNPGDEPPAPIADSGLFLFQLWPPSDRITIYESATRQPVAIMHPPDGAQIWRLRLNPTRPQAAMFLAKDDTAQVTLVDLDKPRGVIRLQATVDHSCYLSSPPGTKITFLERSDLELNFSTDGRSLIVRCGEALAVVDTVSRSVLRLDKQAELDGAQAEGLSILLIRGYGTRLYMLPGMRQAGFRGSKVRSARLDPSGKLVAAGTEEGLLELWSARTKVLDTAGSVLSTSFSSDSRLIASLHEGGTVLVHDIESDKVVFCDQLEAVNPQFPLPSVAFSPSDRRMAVDFNGRVALYDTNPWRRVGVSAVLSQTKSPYLTGPLVPEFVGDEQWLLYRESKDINTSLSIKVLQLPSLRPVYNGAALVHITRNAAIFWDDRPGTIEVVSVPEWRRLFRFQNPFAQKPLYFNCRVDSDLRILGCRPPASSKLAFWDLKSEQLIGIVPLDNFRQVKIAEIGTRAIVYARADNRDLVERLEIDPRLLRIVQRTSSPEMSNQFPSLPPFEFDSDSPNKEGREKVLTVVSQKSKDKVFSEVVANEQPALRHSPDWRYIGVTATDGAYRIYPLRSSDLVSRVCQALASNFSHKDWKAFFGEEPYHATCPGLHPEPWMR
jgi:WD40 repeat protein